MLICTSFVPLLPSPEIAKLVWNVWLLTGAVSKSGKEKAGNVPGFGH
jgi:hypothetical protein